MWFQLNEESICKTQFYVQGVKLFKEKRITDVNCSLKYLKHILIFHTLAERIDQWGMCHFLTSQPVLLALFLLFICFCFSPVFISQLIYYAVSVKGRHGKKLPEVLSDLWTFLTKGIGIFAYYKFYFLMSTWFHTHVFMFTIRGMTILSRNIILGMERSAWWDGITTPALFAGPYHAYCSPWKDLYWSAESWIWL